MADVTTSDALIGRTIAGKYVIESFLGGGAMGSVYRSLQFALDKVVAIKVMRPDLARDPSFIGRFRREAKAASKLAHPASINVTDFGEEPDGLLYIVMEYVAGRDLESIIQESTTPLPDERIAGILSQVLSAVAVAHDLGIVHRDLKPANILIVPEIDDEGRKIDLVKVCDFGIASMRGAEAETAPAISIAKTPYTRRDSGKKLTAVGTLLGTPEYMSPEQASGHTLDAASDLYSIGAILYELLTMRTVYVADSPEQMVLHQVLKTPEHPRTVRLCNENLAAVCMRALGKKPADRYPSARAMRTELRAAVGEVSRESAPIFPPRTTHTGLYLPTPSDAIITAVSATSSLPPHRAPEIEGNKSTIAERNAAETIPAPTPRSPRKWILGFVLSAGIGIALGGYSLAHRGVVPATVTTLPSTPSTTRVPTLARTATPAATGTEAPLELPDTPMHPKSAAFVPVPATPPGVVTPTPSAVVAMPEPVVVAAPALVVANEPAFVVVAPPPVAQAVATPTPTPTAPAAPFVPNAARVTASVVAATRTSRATVTSVVSHVSFDSCYRDALRTLGRPEGGAGTAHLDVDEDGIVTNVSVKLPGTLSSANGCFAAKLRGQRVGVPDTGNATADLAFTLTPN